MSAPERADRSAADADREAAVLDIGSNSIRLVAYRVQGRAITPFLNEKVMAGLGRDLRHSGTLSPQGVHLAMQGLRRFRLLLDHLGVAQVHAVATAAVREAVDGSAFVAQAARETGFEIRVLPGEEEARLSALGVLAGAPDAMGVAGDLGGSSLELVEVAPAGAGRGETHACGPLALMNGAPFAAERVADAVDAHLARSKVLGGQQGSFYAVGGAWRALGRIDITLRDHPLGVLHHHVIPRADAMRVIEFIRKQSRRSLERMEEAAAKRAETLPYAAVVLERVLRAGAFERVVLSSFGLREGVIFDALPPAVRGLDPLVAAAEAMAPAGVRARAFGAALEAWLAPVLLAEVRAFGPARDRAILAAAARLADVGGAFHPDQRGEIIFDLILRAPFTGVSHQERAFIAASIHHRYSKSAPVGAPAYEKLLDEPQKRGAAALGAGMRLGADISARSAGILSGCSLSLEHGVLTLRTGAEMAGLVNEQTAKRLEALAQALGAQARVVG